MKELGKGSFGTVWEAICINDCETYAVKETPFEQLKDNYVKGLYESEIKAL